MRFVFYSCLLSVIHIHAFCQATNDTLARQASYIINAKSYKPGIYMDFEQFKYNSPAIVDHYFFDGRRFWIERNGERVKIKKKTIWGYSDGKQVYMRWNKYTKIEMLGRYCYLNDEGFAIVFRLPFFLPSPTYYNDRVVINYNTGATYLLNTRLVRKILETDPELLAAFEKEKRKKRVLLEYIIKYNTRNRSGIE